MTRAAETNLRHEVTEVLDAAVACGLTAIRTWAFCEGKEWNALQPSPGIPLDHIASCISLSLKIYDFADIWSPACVENLKK